MIEWATNSWNPTVGCSMVSPGCASCYAMKQAWRNHKFGTRGYEDVVKATPQGARWTGTVNFIPSALGKPLTRRKPSLWFVNSMSDLFHENVTNEQIAAVMGVIMATAARSQHYVVLTKRFERVPQWLKWLADAAHPQTGDINCRGAGMGIACLSKIRLVDGLPESTVDTIMTRTDGQPEWPPKNLWIGPSIENQETCNQRLPVAAQLHAAGFNTVLSLEPLLGPVDLLKTPVGLGHLAEVNGFDPARAWVLLGGESDQGAEARPYDIQWAREIIDTCAMLDVPLFHKQLGSLVIDREFSSFQQWIDKAKSWLYGLDAKLFDSKGRQCNNGVDMMRARDENAFPVKIAVPSLFGRRGENVDAWPEDLRVRQAPPSLMPILEAANRLSVAGRQSSAVTEDRLPKTDDQEQP